MTETEVSKGGEYAGPFRLLETLGKGGLATVKVGLDPKSNTKVAVKIIDRVKLENPREQVSMAREITIMKLLKHKNVLRLHDIFENEQAIFLILDIYDGGDLYGHLTKNGAMRPSEAFKMFKQIIEGIEYCHKNLIVHRDLKPENLLLSGDKETLVISDFGLATGMQGSRNLLKTRCGTVHYISPEVAKGDPYVGMASDVWSCGIILYAMLTAALPFDGPNSVAVLKKIVKGIFHMPSYIPKELQDLINKLLTQDPVQRITIPQIKRHPWYRFYNDDKSKPPEKEEDDEIQEPVDIKLKDIEEHEDILQNLQLLGWEKFELRDQLLSKEMNTAKMFYKLLLQHGSQNQEDEKPEPNNPVRMNKPVQNVKKERTRARHRSLTGALNKTTVHEKSSRRKSERKRTVLRKKEVDLPTGNRGRAYTIESPGRLNEEGTPKTDLTTVPENEQNPEEADSKVQNNPSESECKIYNLQTRKDINQILSILKRNFSGLSLDVTEKRSKDGSIKLRARKSQGSRKGRTSVKVELTTSDSGNVEVSFIQPKKGQEKKEFQDVVKNIQGTLAEEIHT